MTKIITCAELRSRGLEELQALFRSLEAELLRTESGSFERTTALANLENVSHSDILGPADAPRVRRPRRLVTLCRSRGNPPRDRHVISHGGARSGLKHDAFEAAPRARSDRDCRHRAPAPVGGCLAATRRMRRHQNIGQFMERAARWPPLGLAGVG
jgi:hypothetical protein